MTELDRRTKLIKELEKQGLLTDEALTVILGDVYEWNGTKVIEKQSE